MSIPFQDLTRLHRTIEDELRAAIGEVVAESAFIGGPLAAFEEELAAAHGAAAAGGCGSGTDALVLALRALGVGPGDEVVVPAMTFIATAEAVVEAGAVPVVADVDPETLLLTPEAVEAVVTPATKAVIPVHLYGHVVPTTHLQTWVDAGLVVVEDAAQAHLAHHTGTAIGTVGHAACFSFYPGKNLGAFGDGGAVISRDADVVTEVRRVRDHGRASKYLHEAPGLCSRLDGLQAAVLRVKLRHLPGWTDARRRLAEVYSDGLGGHLVPWEDGAVHHLLVVRSSDRDGLQRVLRDRGIGSGIHYPVPLSRQPWLEPSTKACPAAERAADEILSLPMDPLLSVSDVAQVVEAVLSHTTS